MTRWYVNQLPTRTLVKQIELVCASDAMVMELICWNPQRNWYRAWEILLKDRLCCTEEQMMLVTVLLADQLCEVDIRTRTPVDEHQ